MKTPAPRLAKIFGPALLLAACLALSSCIIVAPRHHRHDRHWGEAPASFSHEVRP
jgi:hypothetical protein